MSNRFEDFVRENREAFDVYEPREMLWQKIETGLPDAKPAAPKGRVVPMWTHIRRIAAAVLLLCVGAWLGISINHKVSGTDLAEVSPELAEAEQFYSQRVSTTLEHLEEIAPNAPVGANLEQLERAYEQLRNDFDVAPKSARPAIIRNMIRNYQLRLHILERALQFHNSNSPNVSQLKQNEVI